MMSSMFGMLRKLSGEKSEEVVADEPAADKKKRNRSGSMINDMSVSKEQKRKWMSKSRWVKSSIEEGEIDEYSDDDVRDEDSRPMVSKTATAKEGLLPDELPSETPDWGVKLFDLIQREFSKIANSVAEVEKTATENAQSIKKIDYKLAKAEEHNRHLQLENSDLKEKLLDVEFRQHRNNLIFEGIVDSDKDTDIECIRKIRNVLRSIPGLDSNFRIDRCHRIDGAFNPAKTRRIICCFNWYVDVQFVLRNRKSLPRGVYVNEDFPEEWVDRRKILKPIYNTAKRNEGLRSKTYFSRDKLVIDGNVKFFHEK